MDKPTPHDSVLEHEDDPTKARVDLLSAYTMRGRLERDGLLPSAARPEEAAPVVEPPAPEDGRYYYKAPGEAVWTAA